MMEVMHSIRTTTSTLYCLVVIWWRENWTGIIILILPERERDRDGSGYSERTVRLW